MALGLKLKKSAGVPVTGEVHRIIAAANAARDAGEWQRAADGYRRALAADPALRHIWLQLGHMRKEAGEPEGAIAAYEEALRLRPDDAEPLVHIAHLRKAASEVEAARGFVDVLRAGRDEGSLAALQVIVEKMRPVDLSALRAAALHVEAPTLPPAQDDAAAIVALDRVIAAAPAGEGAALAAARALLARLSTAEPAGGAASRTGIVFDVTDLIAHYRYHRLPTGIQRVQIEVVTRALADRTLDVRVCCFIEGRDDLYAIPGPLFADLARVSTAGGGTDAPDWLAVSARLLLTLAVADPFTFKTADKLVNLGTSWWVYNYFLLVRNAKRDHGISYVPFVHDFIPIIVPSFCDQGVVRDYVSWLVGVFAHADFFLCNSHSTAQDLMRTAERLGHAIRGDDIEVVQLDADFRQPADRRLDPAMLDRWLLEPGAYCLIVSTIEPRKNHLLALEAWSRMIAERGAAAVPVLVCVGRSGWMNGAFFDRLNRDPQLRSRVRIIERVSDAELAMLYAQSRFTIYPSHYEGWGLPVTESLCYGKVPVIADNSSLPEAGAGYGLLFESDNARALEAAVTRLLDEPGLREGMEARIAAAYRPRSWAMIARQIVRAVAVRQGGTAATLDARDAPAAELGGYHPVTLEKGARIWHGLRSGEVFRAGEGWTWPQTDRSRTVPGGGDLRIRVPSSAPLRLYLLLHATDSIETAFQVVCEGEVVVSGGLGAGEERWVLADLPPAADGIVTLTIRGAERETVAMMNGGSPKQVVTGIAVLGFTLADRDDEAARMRFVESAGLGDLADVNAYRERREVPALSAA